MKKIVPIFLIGDAAFFLKYGLKYKSGLNESVCNSNQKMESQ